MTLRVLVLLATSYSTNIQLVHDDRYSSSLVVAIKNEPTSKTYGVIVDCGSTGTRAHIFWWDSSLDYPDLLHAIDSLRDSDGKPVTKRISPGLSELLDEPDRASDYMEPIIEFLLDTIPSESIKHTSVYILGTAGMRLLNKETQLQIMNDIALDLKSRYDFAKVKASVISGAIEGMYQWITVNSKLKRLTGHESNTYAVMEMGGSSLQVTYKMDPHLIESISASLDKEANAAFLGQIVEPQLSKKTSGHSQKLVSISFLGLGSESAREAYVDLLIDIERKRSSLSAKVTTAKTLALFDPCLPIGATETIKRPLRMLWKSIQTIGFNLEGEEKSFELKLNGTGRYKSCRSNLAEMLRRAKSERLNCKPNEPCTMSLINTSFIPFETLRLYGLGVFYYSTNDLNQAGPYRRRKFIRRSKQICRIPVERLTELYPKVERDRITQQCFNAVWVETFLTEGIKMPSNYRNLETIGKINGDEIEWTLGAALDNSFSMELAAESSS